jgi:hypothetical protein
MPNPPALSPTETPKPKPAATSASGSDGAIDSLFEMPELRSQATGGMARGSTPTISAYGNYRNPSPNSLNGNNAPTRLNPAGYGAYQQFARNKYVNDIASLNSYQAMNMRQQPQDLTPEESQYVDLRRAANRTGVEPVMMEPEVGFDQAGQPMYGQQRMPTLPEYYRQVELRNSRPDVPGLPLSSYLKFPVLASFAQGITEPFRGSIAHYTGLTPYDYTPSAFAPALMAMGIPTAAHQQYAAASPFVDTAARVHNYSAAPQDQLPLMYPNDPLLDVAGRSFQAANLASQTAAYGTGAGAVGAGLTRLAPMLAQTASGTGVVAGAAQAAQPLVRGAQIAATGFGQVPGGSRAGNFARTAANETFGNLNPGILARGPASLGQGLNALFATMAANSIYDTGARNAQQAYADTGSLFDAATEGVLGGLGALTLEPTARTGAVVNAARFVQGSTQGLEQSAAQKVLEANPELGQYLSSSDPYDRQFAQEQIDKLVKEHFPGSVALGSAGSGLGYATAPFQMGSYLPSSYEQSKATDFERYSDAMYDPATLDEVFSGNSTPASMQKQHESYIARFGGSSAPDPKQLLQANLPAILAPYRGEIQQIRPEAVQYFDYMMQDFNQKGPTDNNLKVLGLFRAAVRQNNPSALDQAMQAAYQRFELDSAQNQLVSNEQ